MPELATQLKKVFGICGHYGQFLSSRIIPNPLVTGIFKSDVRVRDVAGPGIEFFQFPW